MQRAIRCEGIRVVLLLKFFNPVPILALQAGMSHFYFITFTDTGFSVLKTGL